MAEQKDTIYIDVDDEITAIIDKVQDSASKVVALVLPKRAAALQSIVNMKLLKRTADESDKHVVLITSEAALLPLAGAVGMYAAKSLQSKPEIPEAPALAAAANEEETVDLEDLSSEAQSAGELAEEDSVEIDNTPKSKKSTSPSKNKNPKKAGKKPKIPNFEKFRTKLFLIIAGVIALLVLWYLAVFVAPSANIVITADTEDVNTSMEFTASTTANSVSDSDKIVPAEEVEVDKEDSQKSAATGEKDVGKKATGSVSMTATKCSGNPFVAPDSVSAGTSLSLDGRTYTTGNSVSFSGSGTDSNGCFTYTGNRNAAITAQEKGSEYNTSSSNFSVSGRSDVSANGSASGGSSKVVKVVSEQDVDTAKGKMSLSDDTVKDELKSQLEEQGYFPIESTFNKTNEKTDVSPNVGEEGSEVTVSYSATFSMLGVKRDDVKALLADNIKDEIDPDRQQIQDDGLDQATFTVQSRQDDGTAIIDVSTIVAVGPNIDQEQLKTDIAGKKRGEAENIVRALPGVKEVTVNYSPFWVNKAPSKPSKITIEFQQADQ